MSSSIEALSQPVSEEMPSGENLEYDPQYMEMIEQYEAKAKAGAAVVGDEQADSGPDWKAVAKLAGGLLERTRDLRVAVYAAIASIHTGGLLEFRDNLELLKIYLDEFWDSVHPQLDPDDDNDPLQRLNTLDIFNDRRRVAMALEHVKLVELKGVGQFGVHEVDLAEGRESPAENEEVSDVNLIRQAFATTEPEKLSELQGAVSDALALLAEIDEIWKEKTGEGVGPGFPMAKEGLDRVSSVLMEFSPGGSGEEAMQAEPVDGEQADVQAPSISGAINSRADVIRVLDKICEYYSVHEPSSPIPLLLRRAQRLVEKSFMEILEDMVPDGVQQARLVSGNVDENM
jgi:type VI secretion system protein ImpA